MEKLIELTYDIKQFDGIMNEETFNVHHGKHLQAYVNNYNAAVENTEYADMDLIEVLKGINESTIENKGAIINNGGGVLNHNIFFEQFLVGTKIEDEGFLNAINESFGSVENMIEELKKAGATRFGSGWSWLVVKDNKLSVISTANQDSPYSIGYTPILAIDVWEHAYYLDYQNRRPEYLEKIFEMINWQVVEDRFKKA